VKKGNLKNGYCWATKGKRSIDRTRNELHGRESHTTPHLCLKPLTTLLLLHYRPFQKEYISLRKSLKYYRKRNNTPILLRQPITVYFFAMLSGLIHFFIWYKILNHLSKKKYIKTFLLVVDVKLIYTESSHLNSKYKE
jgi:hypothetical protein